MSTMPCTTSAFVVVADDAEARRAPIVDVGDVADADGHSLLLWTTIFSMSWIARNKADAADVVGLLADGEALAADVLVGVLDGGRDLAERDALAAQPVGVDLDVVLLGLAAEARDVDDALDLLELALEDPVLGRLQVPERVALAAERVAEDLADGVPRRELRLQCRWGA